MPLKILVILTCLMTAAQADDTELFVKKLPGQPNVLLLIDTSGSMSAIQGGQTVTTTCPPWSKGAPKCTPKTYKVGGKSQMTIVKEAATKFLTDAEGINISLMSFNSYTNVVPCPPDSNRPKKGIAPSDRCRTKFIEVADGGNVDMASEDIVTGRQRAINVVNSYSAKGFAPLNEAFYEAYLYFAGKAPKFQEKSVAAAKSGSVYKSPIAFQCQKSSIVLFTDGNPIKDTSANGPVQGLIRGKSLPGGLSSRCSGEGGCLDELAWYIKNNDVRSGISGDQHISTYTIAGFGGAPTALLTSTANQGGGKYYEASNSSQLSTALSDILLRTIDNSLGGNVVNPMFAAPATSVSASNALETAEDVYYIVFKPGVGPGWTGNLKRYRLGSDNKLYDANGKPAIDPATGFFSKTAKSYWSSSTDGENVELGGMAEKLDPLRPVFTNTTGDRNVNLSSSANRLFESNSSITAAMLGTANATETFKVLYWGQGSDADDENGDGYTGDSRASIGDPMHTQPQAITYYKNQNGSTVDKTVFFTTNDGFLHAVNADNGTTEFSFIPRDLLKNLKIYRDGFVRGGVQKVYGMDGPMTVWINDANGDGDVLSSNNGRADSGDHVYLYLTMRRGGNNIYALDVTNRSQPKLKWVIRGDIDNNHHTDPTGEFGRLGQTWSAPKLVQVNWNGSRRHVLLFGGGYELAIDYHTTVRSSNIGNAVFMVDAESGQMLWRASNNNSNLNIAAMRFSIPASLTPLDMDRDGAVDVIFGADTGGQIFRIDINQSNSGAANFATGGVIAKLSGGTAADARRFFEPVTVALGKDGGYLNIAVGSGYRPSPMSTDVNDRVYVIQDPHVASAPSSYGYVAGQPYTEANLYNATSNLLQQGNAAQRAAALSSLTNAKGWFMELGQRGEKVLGKAVIYNGVLLFNSFAPITSTACSPGSGANYLYAVNIENGTALLDLDGNGNSALVKSDRRLALRQSSLAPAPTIISRGNNDGKVCVGTECIQTPLENVNSLPVIRRFWRENR